MMKKSALNRLFLYTVTSGLLFLGLCFIFTTLYHPGFLHLVHELALMGSDSQEQQSQKMVLPPASRVRFSARNSHVNPQPSPVEADSEDDDRMSSEVFSFNHPDSSVDMNDVAQTREEKSLYLISLKQRSSLGKNMNPPGHSPKSKDDGYSETSKDTHNQTLQNISSLVNSDQRYLIRGFTGRLGNVLFQLASALCIAKLNNLKLVVKDVSQLQSLRYQGVKLKDEYWKQLRRLPVKGHTAKTCCGFDPNVMIMTPNNTNHILHGYFQSWKYFKACQPEVRQAIRFKQSITQRAISTVTDLRKKHPKRTLVGVHVRMGDYLSKRAISTGKRIAPPDFYLRAMAYFRSKFHDVIFVVITSKADWFKNNVTNASDVTVLGWSDSPAVDMEVLSRMDHVIFSVGTFGWWIAYKNSGTVVCYKDFFHPGSKYGRQIWNNATDFFYPGWILL